MYAFLEECPKCKAGEVRVDFVYVPGSRGSRDEPAWGAGVEDLYCGRCGEKLDDDEDAVAACLEAADAEIEHGEFPDL